MRALESFDAAAPRCIMCAHAVSDEQIQQGSSVFLHPDCRPFPLLARMSAHQTSTLLAHTQPHFHSTGRALPLADPHVSLADFLLFNVLGALAPINAIIDSHSADRLPAETEPFTCLVCCIPNHEAYPSGLVHLHCALNRHAIAAIDSTHHPVILERLAQRGVVHI